MDNDIAEDVIQQQMQETRASLTEKLETLEQKVVGTVENATTAVTETVDAIKETVHDTVATVQEGVKGSVDSVKDLVDVPAHVQRRPWLMLGGSVAVGYCLGVLLTPRAPSRYEGLTASPGPPFWMNPGGQAALQNRAEGVPPAAAPAEPSIWTEEVAKLKGLALGVLFGTARELLVSSIPAHMGEHVKEVVDSVTKKVGGEPLPSSDWAKLCEPTPPSAEFPEQDPMASQAASTGPEMGHRPARRW
jgi:ElaB/YqjD/DUF883 family membrane-anchored ribosome-binding protein